MAFARSLLPLLVGMMVVVLVAAAARTAPTPIVASAVPTKGLAVTQSFNDLLEDRWKAESLPAPEPADDLTVLRRLSLALLGTVPSLEEIRQFEADGQPDKLRRWTRRMLADPRYARNFAERLARPLVGTELAPFVVFRRDRLIDWLADQVARDVPWDQVARHLIADEGIWTDTPSVNFVTRNIANETVDVDSLAARTVRVFLGQRIDCAQCHDHPFDDWKQHEFEGLAAYYAGASQTIGGITDDPKAVHVVQDAETLEDRQVPPAVPFGDDWLDESASDRRLRLQLADWVTAEQNERFDRAIVNRVWALMMGQPFVSTRPVDDLPDPADPVDRLFDDADEWTGLDLLADDFRTSGRRIGRLVEIIAASDAFRASSQTDLDDGTALIAEEAWALKPLVHMRPDQMIDSMIQASSIRTIDPESHLFVRLLRLVRRTDFVRDYGDLGEDELAARSGTIPQALLRMNGKLARELTEANPFTGSGRVQIVQQDSETLVETAFLMCLTRRPTPAELDFFAGELDAIDPAVRNRELVVEDLFWTLFVSPEFSWIR